MDIKLALMTGIDIPIPECQLILHQPTLKEISLIGETDFFTAIQLICINKEMIEEHIQQIKDLTNFQIFLQVLENEKEKKILLKNVLFLLFPKYQIIITPRALSFIQGENTITLDDKVFPSFQNVLRQVFCLQQTGKDSFNPQSEKAKEIAKKLTRARQRVAAQRASEEGETSLSQYITVITIAIPSMSLQNTLDLTLYQLYGLLERYGLYINWDIDIRARLAGAKAEKKLENWMRPLN